MTEQEYLDKISAERKDENGNYKSDAFPAVVRTADPVLIRFDINSLLVGDSNFYAKLKIGKAFTGYDIYISGLGTPIKEVEAKSSVSLNQNLTSATRKQIEKNVKKEIADLFDILEARIAIKESDNEIKKAIDRLCWQMHYDISASTYDMKQLDGFSEIDIDNTSSVTTIPATMTDSAHIITGVDGGGSSYGSLYDVSSKLNTINSNIITFDNNMNGSVNGTLVTLKTAITTIDANMNDDVSGTIVTLSTKVNKVADNLKSENEYTISKALRDSDASASVSGQLKLQTTEITNGLGPSGSINTSLTSIGSTTSDIKANTGRIDANVDTISSDSSNIYTKVTNISSKSDSISTNVSSLNTGISSRYAVVPQPGGGSILAFYTYGSTNGW